MRSQHTNNSNPVLEIQAKQNQVSVEIRKTTREEVINTRRRHNQKIQIIQQQSYEVHEQTQHNQIKQGGEKLQDQTLNNVTANKMEAQTTIIRGKKKQKQQNMMMFQQAIINLFTNEPQSIRNGLKTLRRCMSIEDNPPIQQVIDCGLLPLIMHFASQNQDETLKVDSSTILINMCGGTQKQVTNLVQKGILKVLGDLMTSSHVNLIQNAIWTVGNIAVQTSLLNALLGTSLIQQIVNAVERIPSSVLIKNAAWAFSNICRNKAFLSKERVKNIAQIMLRSLDLLTDKSQSFFEVYWGLPYLAEMKQGRQVLIRKQPLLKIQQVLLSQQISSKTASLMILTNLFDLQSTQVVFCQRILYAVTDLIFSAKPRVRQETLNLIKRGCQFSESVATTLSNTEKFMQQLIKMSQSQEPKILILIFDIFQKLALILPKPTAISVFSTYQIMRSFALNLMNSDSAVIIAVLNTLTALFQFQEPRSTNLFVEMFNRNGGAKLLQKLQHHNSDQIYDLSLSLLSNHYQLQDSIR